MSTPVPLPRAERAISGATPMQLGFVVMLLGALVTAVTAHVRLDARVESHGTSIAELRAADAVLVKSDGDKALRLQRAEDNYQRIVETLAKMERSLEKLTQKGGK